MPLPSSRTPEGFPERCPVCGNEFQIDPTIPPGDAPCPSCGSLVWFRLAALLRDFPFFVEDAAAAELDCSSAGEAIEVLVGRLADVGAIGSECRDDIFKTIVERERLGSTAIGRGVAVPHCRHDSIDHLVGTWGFSADGVDFGSLDGEPTHLVLLLIAPENRRGELLRALERISGRLRHLDFSL